MSRVLPLYDVFLRSRRACKGSHVGPLPPRNLTLLATAQSIRRQWAQLQAREQPDQDSTVSITTPHQKSV